MSNVLLGVVCLDIYTKTNIIHPGCGILHNAYHLQRLGCEPLLITRIGSSQAKPFLDFFATNHISILPDLVVAEGEPAAIEIDIQTSGEAIMSNFVLGVWEDFQLAPSEEKILAQASCIHCVLAEGVIPVFTGLLERGILDKALVSADFLSFRNFTVASFARLIEHLDLAFIGWKGTLTDPTVEAIREAAQAHQALVVITLGERGIQVFDARRPGNFQFRFFEVEKVAVHGNTNGCGDAFIAYFLAEYWRSRNLEKAVAQGKMGGAKATAWDFALPNGAYQ